MQNNFTVSASERTYLRELARQYYDIALLPVMTEREKQWKAHNTQGGARPMVVMETDMFMNELLPPLRCAGAAAQALEKKMLNAIVNHRLVNDDKVISPWIDWEWDIHIREFNLVIERTYSRDSRGQELGYKEEHPVKNIPADFSRLSPSEFWADKENTIAGKTFIEEIIGDVLPVKITNFSLRWQVMPSEKIINLMGMEKFMTALIDNPDDIQYLYRFISDDIMRFVSWQEESGLLVLNNGNDYIGSGSYGFIDDFPVRQDSAAPIKKNELWVNMNSQETICVSPQMFADYIFPHYYNLAGEFGLVYYGCCEPVHNIWDTCIAKLPKLKKVSISPWCDEQFMGDRLRNSKIIYSRKPNPALIGLGNFDQNIFKRHIADTLLAAKECNLEIIFRDIFTLHGSRDLAGRAVNITRELIDELWQK